MVGDHLKMPQMSQKVSLDFFESLRKSILFLLFRVIPLAKDRGSCVVEWVSQGPHENDDEYLHRIIDTAAGTGLTCRRQGKSRLGHRLQEGTKPSSADRPRLWEKESHLVNGTTMIMWLLCAGEDELMRVRLFHPKFARL